MRQRGLHLLEVLACGVKGKLQQYVRAMSML
jgi:hypothetical protein